MRKRSYVLFNLHKFVSTVLCILCILCVCILTSCTDTNADTINATTGSNLNNPSDLHNPISIDANVTDKHIIGRFNEAYYNLPEWLRKDMINNGWTVQLCADLSQKIDSDDGTEIMGYTTYTTKLIQINADDIATTKRVMCHEAGHYLDYIMGCGINNIEPSQSEEFADIFVNEYDDFLSNISTSIHGEVIPSEYWAECCFYYFALPEKLNTCCPETYKYMQTVISSYSGVADYDPIAYN